MSESCCHTPVSAQKLPQPHFGLAILGLVCASISMLFSMPAMFGISPASWMPWAALGTSALVCIGLGWRFWLNIPRLFWKANMNTLVGLGIAAAYALSFWKWERQGPAELYFDSAAFVAAFVFLGRQVETWIQKRVQEQLPSWLNFLPTRVLVKFADGDREVDLDNLTASSRILVKPGERIPVDARLLSKAAEFDESQITGESKPVRRTEAEEIKQGSINLSQPIELEVLRSSKDSYFHVMVSSVQKALEKKSDIQKRADRWAAILTPLVVLLSIATAFYWGWWMGNFDFMVTNAVAVLVIACPCALGMATPISLFVGMIRAARSGILLNHLDVVERVSEVNVVAFDKTGTLTRGEPAVESVFSIENISQKDVLQWAASLERSSEHPYGRAILKKCEEDSIKLLSSGELQASPGKGLIGKVEKDKKLHEVCVGNIVWLFENGVESTMIPENLRWEAEGASSTVIWVAVDRKVVGIILLTDMLREEARSIVAELQDDSYEVGLITGDAENIARKIAKDLKLQFFHYGVIPEEKAMIVRRLSEKKKKGLDFIYPKVAFVGDGINDAPALAQAHVGIALGSGTALAQSSADAVITNNNLKNVKNFFDILNQTNSLLSQNLWMAFIYNLIALPVAAGVLYPFFGLRLDPGIAALAMALSSVSLMLNSLRALRR